MQQKPPEGGAHEGHPAARLARRGSARPAEIAQIANRAHGSAQAFVILPLLALLDRGGLVRDLFLDAIEGPPIPAIGYVAMGLGIVFSLAIGCGLMALLFYSSRHGYDAPPQYRNDRRGSEELIGNRPAQQKPKIGPYLRLPLRHDFP